MNARNVARLLWTRLPDAAGAMATAALLTSLQGCDDTPATAAPAQAAAPRVTVSAPIQKRITEWDDYSGRFAALENVEVRARVGGFLNSVHFRDGEMVRKGQLLFVIDPRPFEAALAQAQGQLEQARSQVVLSERSLARAGELREQQDGLRAALRRAQAIAGRGPRRVGHGRSGAAQGPARSRVHQGRGARPPGASAGTWSASATS